jgi:hypothetical protein
MDKVDIKYLNQKGIKNVCFSLTKKDDTREKRFIKQRINRGFDDSETWSLRDTIANFILPRIKVFRKITCGTPSILENEKAWDDILAKIERAFELVAKDNTYSWTKEEIKAYEEGMQLFAEYFMDLWW